MHLSYMALDVVFFIIFHCCYPSRTCKCMSTVSKSALKNIFLKILRNLFTYNTSAQLYITTGNTFCKCNDIRFHVEIHKCKHFSCTVKSCHNLITDQKDSIFVTKCTNTFHISVWRKNDTVCTYYRLHQDCCHISGAFISELQIQRIQIFLRYLCIINSFCISVTIHLRVHKVYESICTTDLCCISSPVTGSIGCSKCSSMIASVAGKDLGSSGYHTCHFYSILIGFCSTICEENSLVRICSCCFYKHFCQHALRLGCICRCHEAHLISLFLDRFNDLRKLMSEVGTHQK